MAPASETKGQCRVAHIRLEALHNVWHEQVLVRVAAGDSHAVSPPVALAEGRAVLTTWLKVPLQDATDVLQLSVHHVLASVQVAELKPALASAALQLGDVEAGVGGTGTGQVRLALEERAALAPHLPDFIPHRDKAQPSASAKGGKAPPVVQLWYEVVRVSAEEAAVPEVPVTVLERVAHSYAHGGFMGAALAMMGEDRWRAIFKQVAPKDYAAAHRYWSLQQGRAAAVQCKLMLLLENSPVLCAYGCVKYGCCTPAKAESPQAAAAGASPSKAKLRLRAAMDSVRAQAGAPPVGQSRSVGGGSWRQLISAASARSGDGAVAPGGSQVPAGVESDPERADSTGMHLLRLKAAVDELTQPNRYGYCPLPLEWDVWMSPRHPERLSEATIDHGSPAALVVQAITSALPCCGRVAQSAGRKQIGRAGMAPAEWLQQFGSSVNAAVNGDAGKPLPLAGPEGFSYRWHVAVERGVGGALQQAGDWDGMYMDAAVDTPLPSEKQRTRPAKVSVDGTVWREAMSVWPVAADAPAESEPKLRIELRGDPAGLVKDKGLGVVYVPLSWMLAHGGAGGGAEGGGAGGGGRLAEVAGWWALGPKEARGARGERAGAAGIVEEEAAAPEGGGSSALFRMAGDDGVNASGERLFLRLQLERVSHVAAAAAMGVSAAAAQTCCALLAAPGGLYLDVKSAYSSAQQCLSFVGALAGIGINAKAVCSFKAEQLPPSFPSVLFFHGLNGLEGAADREAVGKRQAVLFNGASFLVDVHADAQAAVTTVLKPEGDGGGAGAGGLKLPRLIDPFVWRQYVTLCERYGFAGGIYIQEPDASAAAVDALCALVNSNPLYLPLGFAYGNVAGRSVSFPDLSGRGFAAQQLLEELAAHREISEKIGQRIEEGQVKRATPVKVMSWGYRLLTGSRYMSRREQRLFVRLLAEMFPRSKVVDVVRALGGPEALLHAYYSTYEAYYPLNVYEASWNVFHVKSLLRTLRNRGALEALTTAEKAAFACYVAGPALFGSFATRWALSRGLRTTRHKHAREALACLLESCDADEAGAVVAAAEESSGLALPALLRRGSTYRKRADAVAELHKGDPSARAYQDPSNAYASLEVLERLEDDAPPNVLHTRDKKPAEKFSKCARKCGMCGLIALLHLLVSVVTLLLWHLYYFGRLLYVLYHT